MISDSSLEEFECALSQDKHFIKDSIFLSECGHHACRSCLSYPVGAKCNICGVLTNRNLRDDKESIFIKRMFTNSLNKLFSIIENKTTVQLDSLKNEIRDFNYSVDARVQYIEDQIELRIESLKTELESLKDNLISEIRAHKADLIKNSDAYNQVDYFENSLAKLRTDIEKLNYNEERFYEYQTDLINLNKRTKELQAGLLKFDFQESNEKLDKSFIGKLVTNSCTFIDSNDEDKSKLMKLCNFAENQKWNTLYRASVDGFDGTIFHTKCDGFANTLTVIKTTQNYVFGGYTSVSWDSSSIWKNDPSAFIFSFINHNNKPVKINCSNPHFAICCSPSYGPTFGGGHDFHIANCSDSNTSSYSNLCYSYELDNLTCDSNEAKIFLAGSNNFQVSEIEVFQKVNN